MEVVVHKPLAIDPAYQLGEDRPGLLDVLDGAGSTGRATHTAAAGHALLLLWRRHQATAERARRVLLLMLFAVICAPVIDHIFTHEWFAAIGATTSDVLAITFGVIGRSFMQVETSTADGLMAGCTEEMIRVPGSSECC